MKKGGDRRARESESERARTRRIALRRCVDCFVRSTQTQRVLSNSKSRAHAHRHTRVHVTVVVAVSVELGTLFLLVCTARAGE